MNHRFAISGLLLLAASAASAGAATASSSPDSAAGALAILRHDLTVALAPAEHGLRATDRMTVRILAPRASRASFSLHPALRLLRVSQVKGEERVPLAIASAQEPPSPGREAGEPLRWIVVELSQVDPADSVLTLEWIYEGTVNDPPREPRHLRFVTPSETAGHIGNEGIYLSGETHWYPDVPGSLSLFFVRAAVPDGWTVVTHGRQVARRVEGVQVVTDWDITANTEALSLVANRFIQARRDWQDSNGRAVEVATYLFPEDAHLSQEYLDASVRYLEAYAKILGPYPFPKFAVVENFFASGLGMPSFTLLGSGSVKRHYVQPYALGHEIVHSWIGNWVLNRTEQGNWVEGLTTYLANYYYEELTGKPDQARDERRRMLLNYAVFVRPEEDYPVGRFRQKTDSKDGAIGYQKSAMVVHLLRREIGEEAFWTGLRRLVADYGGAYAGWAELERVFGSASGKDLRWFFAQWVERAGAPSLTLVEAHATRIASGTTGSDYVVKTRIEQQGEVYRLHLRLVVTLAGERIHEAWVDLRSARETVSLTVPGKPTSLRLDPDFDGFRRLRRDQIPPMLNLFVTDRQRTLMLPDGEPTAETEPYRELGRQMAKREPAIAQIQHREDAPATGSILMLGHPGHNAAGTLLRQACGEGIDLEEHYVAVAGRSFEGPETVLLLSCRRPDHPGSVISLFYGLTAEAAAKVARLLFFYGWQSYVVFKDGGVVARGDFTLSSDAVEVHIEAS